MTRRGLGLLATLALIFGMLPSGVAHAAPAPTPVCTQSDKRLAELSGLVSDGERWYAISDGGSKIEVFVLGRDCAVQRVISNKTDPYDVEDLARSADGRLWLADTGDNRKQRETIALHAVTPQGAATIYRLSYPDGAHDAEALLIDQAGTPYVITKTVFGSAGVYRPASALTSPGPTALEKVGSISIPASDTQGGPVGGVGSSMVTGAASAPDGSVIALRTYTDAYLYPVANGDVLAALQREPVRVPLPGEKQGEAIALEPNGSLLSASEGVGEPIRIVPEAARLVEPVAANAGGGQQASADETSEAIPMIAIAVLAAAGLIFAFGKLRRRQ